MFEEEKRLLSYLYVLTNLVQMVPLTFTFLEDICHIPTDRYGVHNPRVTLC